MNSFTIIFMGWGVRESLAVRYDAPYWWKVPSC